jgi:hypothetical protein
MKVILAIAAVAVASAIAFVGPASNAVEVPRLDKLPSTVENIQAKRPKQSSKSKTDRCIAECRRDCWFNCDEGCRCLCVGMKKGEFCIGPG